MISEKYILSLENAKKNLQRADSMIYFTFPVIKENRFLIKILEEFYNSTISFVKSIVQFEYVNKRAHVYSDARSNLETFEKCAPRYNLTQEQLKMIKNTFYLIEKHKKSAMEFTRKDKYVILSENLGTDFVTVETLKKNIFLMRDAIHKAEQTIIKV